jgi:adenosine kinase
MTSDVAMKQPILKPGSALICGSMAFDTIMVFQDRFRNHILPDKLHMLNVSFLALQMRREFGGCAGHRVQPEAAG